MAQTGERYRHVKRGTVYAVLAVGELQAATGLPDEGDRVVVYRGDDDRVWLRAEREFLDGRFEHLTVADPAKPATAVDPDKGWGWWIARSEEDGHQGPFATREAAIDVAVAEIDSHEVQDDETGKWHVHFHVTEARQDPLRLADWIGADRLLERAEEEISDSNRVSSEYDDDSFFDCTPDQEADLRARIERACDEWQAAHGLTFHANTFSETRNGETVSRELPAAENVVEGEAP